MTSRWASTPPRTCSASPTPSNGPPTGATSSPLTRARTKEYALIAGERNDTISAYDIFDPTAPQLVAITRTGGRPEVVVHIPGTTRFITADESSGISIVAGVDRDELDPDRPQIVSDSPWANVSGFGIAPGGRLLMTTRYGPNDIQELRPAGAPRGELPGRKLVNTALAGRLTDVAADPIRGGYWVTTNQQALVRLNPDGTIAKAFPTLDGFTNGLGVAVAPTARPSTSPPGASCSRSTRSPARCSSGSRSTARPG
jgi:hypothetical protein